jgi:hypothetical protein
MALIRASRRDADLTVHMPALARWARGILGRAERGDRERMHVGPQKVAQRPVHHALPLDPAAAAEGVGDDQEAEVALSLRSSARMAGMARGIVHQLEPMRLQWRQARPDLIRDPHERSLASGAVTIAQNLRVPNRQTENYRHA